MKGSMSYAMWSRMTYEEQEAYLEATNQEVQGYTLVGQDSHPTHVEFCPRHSTLKEEE